jgi:hypothetical protein
MLATAQGEMTRLPTVATMRPFVATAPTKPPTRDGGGDLGMGTRILPVVTWASDRRCARQITRT